MKRILLCIALMGTATIKSMDLNNNNNIDSLTAERKRLDEKGKKIAQQQAVLAVTATLTQENTAQKNTIANLEKEISNLKSKLFFWRTPAILAGLAASVYGSWLVYEWWNGESVALIETAIDENEKASEPDDETSQPSAPSLEDVKDVLAVPNTTPPGN